MFSAQEEKKWQNGNRDGFRIERKTGSRKLEPKRETTCGVIMSLVQQMLDRYFLSVYGYISGSLMLQQLIKQSLLSMDGGKIKHSLLGNLRNQNWE